MVGILFVMLMLCVGAILLALIGGLPIQAGLALLALFLVGVLAIAIGRV